jgi:dTDP-glucose 4,6-dehydratase
MKNLLVTGGAGFIGSNFIRRLLSIRSDVFIVNLDALTYAGSKENLGNLPDSLRHIFVHGNILDQTIVEGLLRSNDVDTIVHFAAESHVDKSIRSPQVFWETNAMGTLCLLEAARTVWISEQNLSRSVRFHHISTDEVYGTLEPGQPPFTENTCYQPTSPYAASKASSDHLIRAYAKTYNLPVTISNCSNNYGPFQYPEKLIPLMILNAMEGKDLPVYGDGMQVRDWLFVNDHIDAIVAILETGRVNETYNIGGNVSVTNLQLVQTLCEIVDDCVPHLPHRPSKSLIQFVADRPGHDRRYQMDTTKIKTELGWIPQTKLEEGLLETVKWYMKNLAWVNHIRSKPSYQEWIETQYTKRENS